MAESATIELHRQMDMWHGTEAELRSRLGGRDSRVRELESELERRGARIADLEQQLSSLEARVLQQSASETERQEELQRLRTQRAELDVMLMAERDATAAAIAETTARESALASERARNAQLEEALAVERQRVTELEGEVAAMSGEMKTWSGVLKNAHQERNAQLDGIHAAEERARSLEQELEKQRTTARELQTEHDERGVRIEALEKANEHWRTTAAVGREPSHADTTALPPEPAAADGVARLLIHSDGGREVVHVLGRKTSIGRTPDNDVQIEGRHISRHHAVILAGPATTLIEDLNSTNGVMVNGRRVVRQVLQDGDEVTIGRTMYRFAVRRAGEAR